MRSLSTGVFVVATLVAGMAVAGTAIAQQCAKPIDKSAFDVAGLKSQLMVTALTCDVREKFNGFIIRFRPDLLKQEKALNLYFGRAFGRRAQVEHDDYITQLANAQSSNGLARGTFFCQENIGLFDEVMALPPGADLAGFAAAKGLVQPVTLVDCAIPPAPATRTATAAKPRS